MRFRDFFGQFAIDAIDFGWGDHSEFKAMFYFALLLIFLYEKDKNKKYSFGLYSIIMLAVVYCPLTMAAAYYVFFSRSGAIIAYYSRLFLMLPVLFCIAYATVLFSDSFNNTKKKTAVFSTMMIIVLLFRCPTVDFGKCSLADNWEKVPRDVKQISESLSEINGYKKVMAPIEVTYYVRTFDSSILLAYGRDNTEEYADNPAARQISGAEPIDPEIVSKYCEEKNCDYLVVRKEDSLKFEKQGYTQFGQTDNYAILSINSN